MGNIARTLLQALRRERGSEVFAPSAPSEALEEALAALSSSANDQGVRLVREIADVPRVNLPGHVVSEVVRSLLSNALNALKGREDATIWIRLEPYRAAGAKVVLRIEDNGPGVPVSIRERRRADGTRSFAVLWTDPDTGRQTSLTYDDERDARVARELIAADGGRVDKAARIAEGVRKPGADRRGGDHRAHRPADGGRGRYPVALPRAAAFAHRADARGAPGVDRDHGAAARTGGRRRRGPPDA